VHPVTKKVLFGDIETHSADEIWNLPPREFFRLGQYAWGWEGDVVLTEDYDEILSCIREADYVVFHNGHAFDLTALFGKDSTEPLEMALENRVLDTMVHAALVLPAPYSYTDYKGHTHYDAASPEKARSWFSLQNLSYQLGLTGKIGDLKAMAKEHGGFCHIPIDNPEFREYARQDIIALRELTAKLFTLAPFDDYAWREQLNAAIDAQSTRNGLTVDVPRAKARIEELREIRERHLTTLVERYNFPTAGKSPWASNAGKEAIAKALADYGISLDELPRTKDKNKRDTDRPSFGGKALISVCKGKGKEAEEFAAAVAELKGQRALAQLALDCMQSDGKVHPSIDALQRSGRKSTTKPGLTVVTDKGPGRVEKAYYVASPGRRLVEYDYSAADTRVVAAYSGDEEFLKQTEPGFDAHELTGRLIFGDETYNSDPKKYRTIAKPVTHGSAYRAGARTLSKAAGITIQEAQNYLDARRRTYPKLHRWQEAVTKEGRRGYVVNAWGRKLIVDKDREFTQAPAQYGQSGTREIAVDALVKMARKDIRLIQWLVIQVHDALVFDVPEEHLHWAVPTIRECMETTLHPPGGQAVFFPVEAGEPALNWMEASHG
jgi:DNA polymerase-1